MAQIELMDFILTQVPQTEVFERLHIFHVLRKFGVKYTRHASGILVPLTKAPLECLEEIAKFLREIGRRPRFFDEPDRLEEKASNKIELESVMLATEKPSQEMAEIKGQDAEETQKPKRPSRRKTKTIPENSELENKEVDQQDAKKDEQKGKRKREPSQGPVKRRRTKKETDTAQAV